MVEVKQMTAVEWLIEEIHKNMEFIPVHIQEQAKALEKQQIMEAVYDTMGLTFDPNMGRAEMYYNEKYNKS